MKKKILEVIKKSQKIETEHFIFFINKDVLFLKTGFSIARYCANAVKRNRIKRILRKLIRESIKTGDIIIRAKPDCGLLTEKEIEGEWKKVIQQILPNCS